MRPSLTMAIEALGTLVEESTWLTAASMAAFASSGRVDSARSAGTMVSDTKVKMNRDFDMLALIVVAVVFVILGIAAKLLQRIGGSIMLTRREFTRLAVAGAASQVVSPLLAQGGDGKIGYCIIGLGRISMDHFMPGALASKNSKITGLVSGHRDKAVAQAAKYGVPESSIYSYENMDQIKNNPAIDAVYVALPNSMHAEYTIRSARAGKHVRS